MRICSIIVLTIFIGCAKTPLDRAKENVKQYVNTMLNEPSYYECVSWGTMDSSFYKDFYEAPMGRCMFDSCLLAYPFQEEKNRRRLERIVQGNRDSTATIMINKVVKFLDEYGVIDKNERGRFFTKHFAVWNTAYNNYKPEFKGYQIEHTFRVKGQKKEKILMKYLFMLDLTYNVIDAEKQTIKAFDSTKP